MLCGARLLGEGEAVGETARFAFAPAAARSTAFSRRTPLAMAGSFYDLKDTDSSGAEIDFAQFKGQVVYCQNVASR